MVKFPKSEGTLICVLEAPLIWPVHRNTAFGYIVHPDADITFRYEPDKGIGVSHKYRNGSEIAVTSCPIEFANEGNTEKKFFKLAVSWKDDDLRIAAGGKMVAGTSSVEQHSITLKSSDEISPVKAKSEEQELLLCRGAVGPVPTEFEEAKSELERAVRYSKKLGATRNLVEVSDCWKAYLDTIVKVRNKITSGTNAICTDDNAAKSWTGQYEAKIRKSDLWSYLLHARNADNHGMKAILASSEGHLRLSSGGVTHISKMVVTKNGLAITFSGQPPNVEIAPGKTYPISVVDRGNTYSPPNENVELFHLAQGGVAFLELWLVETVRKFG